MSSSSDKKAMFAELVRRTLFTISKEPPETRDVEALRKVNLAGQRLFRHATKIDGNPNEVWAAAEALKRTVDVAPSETAKCLRDCLPSERITVEIVDALKLDAAAFADIAPDVVLQLTDAAFTLKSRGRIVTTGPMSLTEDYVLDHARREYLTVLPTLLARVPEQAVPLVHHLVSDFARDHPHENIEQKAPVFFHLRGKETGVVEDMSMFWRDRERSHGTRAALALVEALLSADDVNRATLLDLVAGKTWPAFFFAMIAQRAALHASIDVAVAFSWLTAPVFLDASSTDVPACDLLTKIGGAIHRDDVKVIEEWLLSERATWLAKYGAEDEPAHLSRQLGCLPKAALVTDEAKAWRARLDENGGPPKNLEPFRVTTGFRAPEKWEWFKRHGVNTEDPVIASALELADSMETIAERGTREREEGKKLKRQDGVEAFAMIRTLDELLAANALPPIVKNRALAQLTAGAACAAAVAPDVEELVSLARKIIQAAAESPAADAKKKAGGEGWSDADPQIEAATGILRLVRGVGTANDDDRAIIVSLARADDGRVRWKIAVWLNALCDAAPEVMWSLFDERTAIETDSGTLAAMVPSLGAVIGKDHVERAAGLAANVLQRANVAKAKKNSDGRAEWAELAVNLDVWRDNATARAAVQRLLDDVHSNREEVMAILATLRVTKSLTTDKDGPRTRAHAVMLAVTRGVDEHTPKLRLVAEDESHARRREIEDQIVSQLLFASDSLEGGDMHDGATMLRFFRDAAGTIDLLAHRALHDQAPRYFAQLLVAYARRDANAAVTNLTVYLKANEAVVTDSMMSTIFIQLFTIVADTDNLTTAAQREAIAVLDRFISSGLPAAAQFSELAQRIARR